MAIAMQEVRKALRDPWGRSALVLAFAYGILTVGQVNAIAETRPSFHSLETFVDFLDILPWAALGVAAIMAGPMLLEDDRRGALELYMSRAVTHGQYLAGKVLALLGLSTVTVAVPALVYWAAAYLLFDTQPAGWSTLWLGILGFSVIWSLVVGGLGLGLSCISRSARAATLVLFGGVAAMDIILGELLSAITRSDSLQVLSPISALLQQSGWLFGAEEPFGFPAWWGLLALAALLAAGWGMMWARHPRLKGVE